MKPNKKPPAGAKARTSTLPLGDFTSTIKGSPLVEGEGLDRQNTNEKFAMTLEEKVNEYLRRIVSRIMGPDYADALFKKNMMPAPMYLKTSFLSSNNTPRAAENRVSL